MARDLEKQTSEPNEETTSDNAPLTIRVRPGEEENLVSRLEWQVMCGICCSSFRWRLKLPIMLFPCYMIYFGIANFDKCTISYFIPIYLVALGILLLSYEAILIYFYLKSEKNGINIFGQILGSITIVWFIVGSVFVYKIYEPNYNPLVGVYCDMVLYQCALWSVSILYVVGGLYICLYVCCLLK